MTRSPDLANACGARALLAAVAALVWAGAACDRAKEVDLDESRNAKAEAPESASVESGAQTATKYSTAVEPATLPVGEPSDVRLEIRPGNGLKINKEFPSWSVDFDEVEGASLKPGSLQSDDLQLEEGRAYATATVTPNRPGQTKLEARATFSVCNPSKCHVLRDRRVTFAIRGESTKPPAAEDENGEK